MRQIAEDRNSGHFTPCPLWLLASGRVAAWGGRAIDCSLALELERQLGKHAGRRTPLKPPMMPRAQA